MADIPAELLPQLAALGIIEPDKAHWVRTAPVMNPRPYSFEYVCWCGKEPKRVDMVPFEGGKAPIFIGQCSRCLEIRWAEWLAAEREYIGTQRVIRPAREMYEQGQGK